MDPWHEDIPVVTDDPVLRPILEGRAKDLDEAEIGSIRKRAGRPERIAEGHEPPSRYNGLSSVDLSSL